jgi:hypothetical protein
MWKGGPSIGAPLPPLQEVENEQQELWKAVGRETSWKAGRCRHVQTWELFSLETCDQAVMGFLAATGVGKYIRRRAEQSVRGSLSFHFVSFYFKCDHSFACDPFV